MERVIKLRRSLWNRAADSEVCYWIVVFVSLSQGGYCQPGSRTDRGCVWVGCLPICALFQCMAPCLHHTDKPVFRGHVIRRVAGALIGTGWVDMCRYGLYSRCEKIVVPCYKWPDTRSLLNLRHINFSFYLNVIFQNDSSASLYLPMSISSGCCGFFPQSKDIGR